MKMHLQHPTYSKPNGGRLAFTRVAASGATKALENFFQHALDALLLYNPDAFAGLQCAAVLVALAVSAAATLRALRAGIQDRRQSGRAP